MLLHVSLFVELLRSHPRALVLAAALVQGALWWLVPSLAYTAPPADLPLVLAVGHEFQLGSFWGPPLAHWVAEVVFSVAGLPGVYLVAQLCVVATFLIVYRLGRSIVGDQHAAMAVLLMAGITAFSVPTPDFGPPVLAMPLVALALLTLWRIFGEGRQAGWYVLGIELAVLILTSYAGVVVLAAIAVFTATSRRGRAMLLSVEPWIALAIVVVLVIPHLLWLDLSGVLDAWIGRSGDEIAATIAAQSGRVVTGVVLAHLGALALAAIALGRGVSSEASPVLERKPSTGLERRFVLFFALVLPAMGALAAVLSGGGGPLGGLGPYLVLSGLAIVVLAGPKIRLVRQGLTGLVWSFLLLAPPLAAAAAVLVLPLLVRVDMPTGEPAAPLARFFGESFERRTGRPLAIVAGDPRLATLVAAMAPSRPSLYLDAAPAHTPWVTPDDLRRKGAIVVWRTDDTDGTPPADIRARFPDLVPEVPRSFERRVQGRLPLLRVGWGMIRPQ